MRGQGEEAEEAAERNFKAEAQFWREWDYWQKKNKKVPLTDAFRNYLWHRCLWQHGIDPAAAQVGNTLVA